MTIGIVLNIEKHNIPGIVNKFLTLLNDNGIDFLFSKDVVKIKDMIEVSVEDSQILELKDLGNNCDVIVSFGGDGTMLYAAYELRYAKAPLMGLNLGKLGFLAEFDLSDMNEFINIIKEGRFVIEERMALTAYCNDNKNDELYAVNDVVIDKGRWPKMIEITIKVDDNYVSTFSADGLIIATPTGSTGYSLSTGGPVVHPKADAITLSPISPHSLTMRPLVISSRQKIRVEVKSPYESIQINSDGQRVHSYKSPVTVDVTKSDNPVKLVHSDKTDYFQILRNKLFWGLDVRKNSNNQ